MNKMPQVTLAYALLLIVIGIGGYFYYDRASVTILIPAFFGIPVLIFGLIALKEKFLKHAMHGASLLALLGIAATFKGIKQLPTLLSGEEVLRPNAVVMQSAMFSVSLLFFILCGISFVKVRMERKKATQA